jgi:A/G-specific adenine glycosylase
VNRKTEAGPATAARVAAWFEKNARDLPWRRTRDPYAIWISAVMLQQTQVKTVIPYWERWMKRFPSVHDLARADEESVLKAWEGLGYYRRARNLQSAARLITETMDGVFPRTFAAVLVLPGIGRYTAGAICSIAFGDAVPVLDGNVARVLSRVRLISGQKELWGLASELVQTSDNPSALNQGLMELGALICTPREPACARCPIHANCAAFRSERILEFPRAVQKPRPRQRRFVAVILRKGELVLVRKREAEMINGALWEFPNFELTRGRGGVKRQLAEFLNGDEPALAPLATIRHAITNNRITLAAYAGETTRDIFAARLNARWTAISQLDALPFGSAHAKLRGIIQGRAA